jgi:hypothetical protein
MPLLLFKYKAVKMIAGKNAPPGKAASNTTGKNNISSMLRLRIFAPMANTTKAPGHTVAVYF